MPSGAAVIKYEGKRGVVWRLKFRDADGRQVQETLGRQTDGWTQRKATAELRARLTDVRRAGLRRVERLTFAKFAGDWVATYPETKGLKRTTREGYCSIIDRHFNPAFGHLSLEAVTAGHVERYIATKRKAGFAPATVNRHLNLLNLLFENALRHHVARLNPVSSVDRPKEQTQRWKILTPAEVTRVERAFTELAVEADGEERTWREQARVIFLTVVGTGLRRGEILGLHWRDVDHADPSGVVLRVRETWVRSDRDTPKSEAGERTIALGPRVAEELWQHRRRSSFQGEDERVFCSTTKGTPFDVARYAKTLRIALARAGIEGHVRPFHDGRHTAITNDAASGNSPMAIMKRAGHSSFTTTQRYIDLAGVMFREEAERLEGRLFGGTGTRNGYKETDASPEMATTEV